MAQMIDLPQTIDPRTVTLAILAGGQSRRMGISKAALTLGGKPILQYLLESLQWPGPTLLVTAPGRENPPAAALFHREAVDPVEQGPLRGVLTALQHSLTEITLITTVDMPAMMRLNLQWFTARLASQPAVMGIMTRRTVDGVERIEPFPLALRQEGAGLIEQQLRGSDRSVHALSRLASFKVEPAPPDWPEAVWTNMNWPGDYEAFEKRDRT